MQVTSVGIPTAEIHYSMLQALSSAIDNGTLVEAIPEVIKATYLGPTIDKYKISSPAEITPELQSERKDVSILLLLILIASVIFIPLTVKACVKEVAARKTS
jgi:hypothetical protein